MPYRIISYQIVSYHIALHQLIVACVLFWQSTSLPRVYRLFRGLGLRHLLVISDGSGARERADSDMKKQQQQQPQQQTPTTSSSQMHQRFSTGGLPDAAQSQPQSRRTSDDLPSAGAINRPSTRSTSSMSDELSRGGALGLGPVYKGRFGSGSPTGPVSSQETRPAPIGGRVCGIITRKDLKTFEHE